MAAREEVVGGAAVLARAPGFPFALFFKGLCCLREERLDEAEAELRQLEERP